ncbi:M3 family oligoendopeptidase [Ruminiclostridium cellobioparum]|uniref:Oligoendopeptidase, pepF/M3 family n=1 Tax=Ruminiclostridium cellobioparum subsp. termitidis CT1112 TaxID=1195236 RepID=S0FWS8_RUMCE|nr:M3 family oligoendopeptidase [Ruminiclostridium cellobioparum]EMS73013.1 oligoendopeptidase, pepF/M3 family [Ruminiclostridium cellobioparum subsp. termitidis CT1112]
MDYLWSLKDLYSSFDGEDFKKDMGALDGILKEYINWVDNTVESSKDIRAALEQFIGIKTRLSELASKLYNFSELSYTVDTKNEKATKNMEILEVKLSSVAEANAKINKWIGSAADIDNAIQASDILKEHEFYLKEIIEKSSHLLDGKQEAIIARMKNTGSSAWLKLKDLLTSTLKVDIELDGEKKQLPLSIIRNMAYESSRELRKKAYEAELASYEKIDDSLAACLNGIKGEVITVAELRGFGSPLEETLFNSRMEAQTLESMLAAMRESLPAFRKYLRTKGQLLGSKNGLPFFDLFAPMGDLNKKYTYEEAVKIVDENYRTFSSSLADFAKKAIESNWIDVYPREGKIGGAFCQDLHVIGQSRVMLNFGGTFSDIITMVHELGHAYHDECIKNESMLNSDYPMPLAETASTFCETIVKKAAIKAASKEEAFAILEMELSDVTQVIVDIYSRFLFESELFKRRKDGSLSTGELNEIMLWTQKEAYGDGLDPEYMHKYMWACKPHYYTADTNFYNFPYAFGQLFAKGLYAEYEKRGKAFVKDYEALLRITGKNKIEDVTKMMNIDVRGIDFWRNSLKTIEQDIEKFLELSAEKL